MFGPSFVMQYLVSILICLHKRELVVLLYPHFLNTSRINCYQPRSNFRAAVSRFRL